MESIDQDRWVRLREAARHANGGSGQAVASRASARGGSWALLARAIGALAVLSVGAVHLQQYDMLYSAIPTIGTLFVLNFAGATAIGLGLLVPVERMLGRRWGGVAVRLLVLAGIGLAGTSFAFLAISEQTPLFGFMEPGYDPTAILASRVAEAVAVVSLGAYGAARFFANEAVVRW